MNINLIYPSIPSPLDRHIPGTTITACHILNTLAEQIKLQLKQSAKDTPSASIRIITAPIENLIRRLTKQARSQAPSANLNIILQLGASAQDDRWHTASGFTVTSQPANPQSDQLSDLLIRQALRILGHSAIANPTAAISQREHSTARLLDISSSPAVLTTCLYIDNAQNANLLRADSGISMLAAVHTEALKHYLKFNQ
ncbi:MAG: N-acetylmuramoyl-L-alanine amidase [Bacteroidaceae bacterium]|nr:N-acetylmuramoyl-L-alanine amidase [Bacteroidaceae bacterium]MBR5705968.1 N-acetylmuramoyl-L-alanine amidase [Bacteroidaceae bacterium]